jgi:5-methylcytosine-specific restriction endonuclease McrA
VACGEVGLSVVITCVRAFHPEGAALCRCPECKQGGSIVRRSGSSIRRRAGIFRRFGFTCYLCDDPATTLDHVIPRARGGSNRDENLRPCCRRCNEAKGDLTLAEYLAAIEHSANGGEDG